MYKVKHATLCSVYLKETSPKMDDVINNATRMVFIVGVLYYGWYYICILHYIVANCTFNNLYSITYNNHVSVLLCCRYVNIIVILCGGVKSLFSLLNTQTWWHHHILL